uniref:Uncharacterized protein n=1 Tax=mine drainage metagenome TaxID=410659 RepID=E6PDF7_9ZZZZ
MATIQTPVGFILEPFLFVKPLFSSGKREFAAAINAVQHFINVH